MASGAEPGDGGRRDGWGTAVGLLVFLAGVGLIGYTFTLALALFQTPPEIALGITPDQPIDLGGAVGALAEVLVRVLLLVVMALIGAMLASRGIKLYASGRPNPPVKDKA